jgi:phage shock protein C
MENVTATPVTPAPPPRLYRSRTDRAIAGVCGGLASYFKVDPALVRILFIIFALAGGASILLYLVLWIAIPSESGAANAATTVGSGPETLAALLIAVGALWLLANVGAFAFIEWRYAWPVALIALGVALLGRRLVR